MAQDPGSGTKQTGTPKPKGKPPAGNVGYLTDKPATGFRKSPPQAKGPPPRSHDPHQQIPVLKAHGFMGGIDSWNARVQKVHDAYVAQHGNKPSPGLVFDVARSPHVMDQMLNPSMFDVAQTPRRAVMRAEQQRARMAGETQSERPDGLFQMDNHYKMLVPNIDHPAAPYGTYKDFYAAKQGKYSMVEMGAFPFSIPSGASVQKFWEQVGTQQTPEAIGKYGHITLAEADRIVKTNTALGSTDKAAAAGTAAAIKAGSVAGLLPSSTGQGQQEKGLKDYARAVTTVGGAQAAMQKAAPWKFGDLPVTGYMSPAWIRAYSSWSRSDDFGMQTLKYYAKLNAFEPTAKGVAEMNQAYHYKLKLMNDPKEVANLKVIQAIPLRVIADMNWNGGVPHDPAQMMKNVWAYMHTGTSHNPVVGGLQDAFHGVKLGLATATGYYTQAKADLLAITSMANLIIDSTMSGKQLTRDDAAKLMAEKLRENPTWARILSGGKLTDKNEPEWAKVLDETSNFAVDFFIGAKFTNPAFKALAMTKDAAESSVAVGGSSRLAYNALLHNDLRQAVRDLHGGPVAEKLASKALPFVREGKMTWRQFHGHVSDLYGNRTTTFSDGKTVVEGAGILGRYASPAMRNMGYTGFVARRALRAVTNMADDSERAFLNLKGNGYVGSLGQAESLIRGARTVFGYAVPKGAKEIFASNFPQSLHTFLVGNGVMSRDEATLLTNRFIQARATQNVGLMKAILEKAHGAYREKFPLQAGKQDPSIFEPHLETEQLSRFNFPSGKGVKATPSPESVEQAKTVGETLGVPSPVVQFGSDTLTSVKRMGREPVQASMDIANSANDLLNKVNHVWRTVILIKNVGRFWKHALRDSLAAMGGGWRPIVSSDVRAGAAEAHNFMSEHPGSFRQFSTARGRSAYSELHWLSGDYWVDGQRAWNMGEFYGRDISKREQAVRLEGAVAHVRKMLSSDAYEAYLKTTKADLEPLVDVILKNPGIKNAFWNRTNMLNKFRSDLEGLMSQDINLKQLTLDEGFAGKEKLGATQLDAAHQYAAKLHERFYELEKSVHESGGTLDELWHIMHSNPGLADKAMGDYLKKYQVPVHVHDGTMVIKNGWDALSEGIIKKYMLPNFFARRQLFDHTFNSLFHDYRAAGVPVEDAIQAAAHTAEQVTVKHMLDFTNQLQFEQKFRWLIPFFTKHRLYVGWLASIARQYPALSLPVSDIADHLDPSGNVNFDVPGLGGLKVNMLRMMWLNTEDQPATVPAAAFIPGLEHFSGSESIGQAWFGGTGEAVKSVYKLFTAHTYEDAVRGMSPASVRQIDRLMVSYGIHYQDTHPGMPIPQGQAVRYALTRYAYTAFTNDTMFTPVTFQGAGLPPEIQKLSDQYTKLYSEDPSKAAKFLDENPRVGLSFGIYKDTNVFWHNQEMFQKLRDINKTRDSVEGPLLDRFQRTGVLSTEDLQAMRAARKQYGVDYQALLVADAEGWQRNDVPGFPPGVVKRGADGRLHVTTSGPFGAGAALADGSQKLDDWLVSVFPNLPKKELLKVWGEDQDTAQAALDRLTLSMAGGDPDTLKKMRAGYQAFLAPYRDLPRDPAGKVVSAYFTAREKWYKQATPLRAELKTASGSRKGEIQDQLRLLDAQSQIDSTFKYQGKTYKGPAFAVSSYYDQPPAQRVVWALTNLVNASYENLSSTDKLILGVGNNDPIMDAAWVAYHKMARQYKDGQRSDYQGSVAGYKQYYAGIINQRMTAAGHPGFMQDWLNSTKPKYQLVRQYKPLQESRYKQDWQDLFTVADALYRKTISWKESDRVSNWQYHVAPSVLAAVKTMPQGFQDELNVAGGQKFIWSLLSSANNLRSP